MSRSVVYRANGSECSITMMAGRILAQKIDVSEMTLDQRVETMGLSVQWMKDGTRRKRVYNAASKERKARVMQELNLTTKVAEYAAQMAEFTVKKREARSKARLETLNKMLKEEGR